MRGCELALSSELRGLDHVKNVDVVFESGNERFLIGPWSGSGLRIVGFLLKS